MTYYIIGRLYVERWTAEEGEEVGGYEVLHTNAISDTPFTDEGQDLDSIFDEGDLPKEPGVYAIMYAASMHPYQDYWGEHDVDVEVEWTKVTRMNNNEVKAILGDGEYVEEKVSFEDLLNELGQGDVKCLK